MLMPSRKHSASCKRSYYLRMRGEETAMDQGELDITELPPHTRRRDSAVVDRVDHEGITSAYAEKSESELGEDWLGRNYLRIRGEEA